MVVFENCSRSQFSMKRNFWFAILIALFVYGSGLPSRANASSTVFVSIIPQKYFVQQISGDLLNVEVMVPPGASPHTYEPKPSQMRKLAEARAYFTIGIALEEAWLSRISKINPDMKVVHTEAGIDRMAMGDDHHHDEHQDDPPQDGEHREDNHHEDEHQDDDQGNHQEEETGLDPHVWLSPALVKSQVETIRTNLATLDPQHAEAYQDNAQRFTKRIDELDTQLRNILAGKEGMKFMVFHPSWGYFARDYGLEQVAVEIEGKSPKPAHLRALIELAREQEISVIFAQPQFSSKSAEVIAREIGAQVVLIDPLGEQWFDNMRMVADKMAAALR